MIFEKQRNSFRSAFIVACIIIVLLAAVLFANIIQVKKLGDTVEQIQHEMADMRAAQQISSIISARVTWLPTQPKDGDPYG